jgi:hypothetical protein
MISRAPHLQDDALVECYYAARRGETVDPPSAEHLADCGDCARRYSEVGAFLTGLSHDADADIDALFPPERLRAQQQDITRRLTLVGRAARVISFPGRVASAVTARPRTPTSRLVVRWVAAAAVAGLFVGIAASSMFYSLPRANVAREARRSGVTSSSRQGSTLPSRLSPAGVQQAVVDMDDMFMSDLESVLDRPHTSELVAFDALTPHVREVRDLGR